MCGISFGHESVGGSGFLHDFTADNSVSIGTLHNRKNSVLNNQIGLIVDKQTWKLIDLVDDGRYYCTISKRLKTIFRSYLKVLLSNLSEIRTSRKTLKRSIQHGRWTKLETIKNISRILGLDRSFVNKNILYTKTKNSFPIRNKEINISPELARITGHILGDGGIHIIKDEGKYRVFYVNNEHTLLNSFCEDIKVIFGKVRIYSRDRDYRGNELWLPTTIGLILNKIINIGNSHDKKIPGFILNNQNHYIIKNFLQSIFDDEGYLYPQKHIIGISLVNPELLSEIKYLLEKVGIRTNPMHIHKSKNRSTMFYFNITGKENILKFHKKINFIHPVKKEKLYKLVDKYGD